MKPFEPVSCREVVELGTAYLERAITGSERERFEVHCRACASCQAYLKELRLVVGAVEHLRPRDTTRREADVAKAVELFRRHGVHGEHPPVRDVPLGIGSHLVAPGDHIAYLWESEPGFQATAGFVATGMARDEACVLLGHDSANRRVITGLERLGLNTADLRRHHRLHVVAPTPSGEALLGVLEGHIRAAVDRGLIGVRVLGNLGWGEPGWPSDDEILKLEARVTNAVRRYPAVVVCSYDVDHLSAKNLLKGGFECHPAILHRDTFRRNEAFVPAESFLSGLGDRED